MAIRDKAEVKQKVSESNKTIDFQKTRYEVQFKTSLGTINLELYPDVAPGHCKNIISLSKIGFYDGLTFHRIVKDFVIQGGCPEGTGASGPGYTVNAEFNTKPHEPGVLSMARSSDPNSAGSQFFLCLAKVPFLDNQYTVFGKTSDKDSLDVVLKIGKVTTGPQDRPHEDVIIESATVKETPL